MFVDMYRETYANQNVPMNPEICRVYEIASN